MPQIKFNKLINELNTLSDNPENQVSYLKQTRIIFNSKLWKRTCELLDGNSHPAIVRFLKDGMQLRALLDEAMDGVNQHQKFLQKLKWETLLASFAVYLEHWYFLTRTEEQYLYKRFSLIPILQRVSADKIRLEGKKTTARIQWGGKRAVESALNTLRSRVKRGKPIDAYDLFKAWDFVLDVETIIDNYCFKGWEIRYESELEVLPTSNSQWHDWESANHKYQLIDRFYLELPYITLPEQVKEIKAQALNVETAQHNIAALGGLLFVKDFLGTTEVEMNGITIDLYETLQLIGRFDACYKASYIQPTQQLKAIGIHFEEIINTLPCVSSRTKQEMLGMMTQYDSVKPREKRLKSCLTALELFAGPPHMTAVDNGQFLRSPGNNYIIMPRFFHGDVKTALLNSVIRKVSREDNDRQFSEAQEKILRECFSIQGYSVIVNWKYSTPKIMEGEIDVLAYKDGYLFVVEAKFTYFRDKIHGIYTIEDTFIKAGEQLNKALDGIVSNYESLRISLSISECHEDLTIVPLIVSTTPEFDFKKYSGFSKISQFELQGLLKPEAFVFMRYIVALYNASTEISLAKDEAERQALIQKYQPDDLLHLEIQRVQEQSAEEAGLIAAEPEKLVQAIETRAFWKGLGNNRAVKQGPIKTSLTLKNGDMLRYVI